MLTILIADDEQHSREGIVNSINWKALQIDKIFIAIDGAQALEIAQKNKIDLLLSDIRMPIVDGIQLSKCVLELYPDCMLIFMSAYSDKEYLMSAIELKARNYIEKPLQIHKLKEVLEDVVKMHRENEYKKVKSIMVENNYKLSMPLIKNEIALLASNKNADMNLLKDCIKNEMLGICANSSYITMLIRAADYFNSEHGDKGDRTTKSEFFSMLSNVLSHGGFEYFCGTRDDEEFIVHVYAKGSSIHLNPAQIPRLVDQWLNQLKNKRLFVSIGTLVPDFTQIHKSYAAARNALNKCFFRGYGSIVCYSQDIAKIAIIEKEILDQFTEALECTDPEASHKMLQNFSVQLVKYENANVDEIKNVYYKMMVILLTNLQAYGISSLSTYENDNSLRNEIYSVQTLEDLDHFCSQLLGIYYDSLKKLQGVKNISMIIHYIEKNFSEKTLEINQISENMFLSPAYLCTYFKRETGKTINQYITDYRLRKAVEYLADKKHRISDVAGMIGYDDNYFARIFKKKFGVSPSEYRERIGKSDDQSSP